MRATILTVIRTLAGAIVTFLTIAATAGAGMLRPMDLSAAEVVKFIRDFIDESGGEWDWDEFTKLPIKNPDLEDIRVRAAEIKLPADDSGMLSLRALLADAEEFAKQEASR